MKQKTVFVCRQCGYQNAKWLGKCPTCNSWNTLEETVSLVSKSTKSKTVTAAMPSLIGEIDTESEIRFKTGIDELDRVLGGGLVQGSLVLVGGDPGIGKSTLLLQICKSIGKKVLYISGEESERQIKLRAQRLGVESDSMYLVSETDVEAVVAYIEKVNPDVVIIDSIQTMSHSQIASSAGSVSQVREATNIFMNTAKRTGTAMFIVGHVTKDGNIAGPRVLEHMVDCVLYFEGDRQNTFRILRGVKNRFGSTNEIGVFEMCGEGLREVENPSAMLLDGRPENISGSSVVCSMEGSRGVLAEVQSLVTPTGFGNPRRMSSGADLNRVVLLIAVLEKRAKLKLSNCDVYVNVAGGLRIDETAADLGICAAIATALSDTSIPSDMLFCGEVGLGGEIRSVAQLDKRLTEAVKMGFKYAVVPAHAMKATNLPKGITLYGAADINEALGYVKKKK